MNDRIPDPQDATILKKAERYANFSAAVAAHANNAFARGARSVRVSFLGSGMCVAVSDDGRPLARRQIDAMTRRGATGFRTVYEKLGLPFAHHGMWLRVQSGTLEGQTSLPSASGYCMHGSGIDPDPARPTMVQFVDLKVNIPNGPSCSNASDVLRDLPAHLTPERIARVTVVDEYAMEWKLGAVPSDLLALRFAAFPSLGAKTTLGNGQALLLRAGEACVPIRAVIDRLSPSWTKSRRERFEPLRSPWLSGTIGTWRFDGEPDCFPPAPDFPDAAYDDGRMDVILSAVDRCSGVYAAQMAAQRIAEDIRQESFVVPFAMAGQSYEVEPPSWAEHQPGGPAAWISLFQEDKAIRKIEFDPLHPSIHETADPVAIVDILRRHFADLPHGQVAAQEAP